MSKRGLGDDAPKAKSADELKKEAGYRAVDDHVRSGMVVGLGTGSTAYFAVERVGTLLKSGKLTDIRGIPTSQRTMEHALSLGIPLVELDTVDAIDVCIDGADAVGPKLDLVKGGGGALHREKMVASRAKKFVTIVDSSKLSESGLGPSFPLPVEVTQFSYKATVKTVCALPSIAGCKAVMRLGKSDKPAKATAEYAASGDPPAVTDNGNYLVDLFFEAPIADARAAAAELKAVIGVVDHGLFCGMASEAIVAASEGVYVKYP